MTGDTVALTATIDPKGAKCTYAWSASAPDHVTFSPSDSAQTTATIAANTPKAKSGKTPAYDAVTVQVICTATDSKGNTVESNSIPLTISTYGTPPEEGDPVVVVTADKQSVKPGDVVTCKAVYSPASAEDELTYKWSPSPAGVFTYDMSEASDTLVLTVNDDATTAPSGLTVQCTVTKNGGSEVFGSVKFPLIIDDQ